MQEYSQEVDSIKDLNLFDIFDKFFIHLKAYNMDFGHVLSSRHIEIPLHKKVVVLELVINHFEILLFVVEHLDYQHNFVTGLLEYIG